jgi:hypothetical protein
VLELKLQLLLLSNNGSSSGSASSASISSTDSNPGNPSATLRRTNASDDGNSGLEVSGVPATIGAESGRRDPNFRPDPNFRRDPNHFKVLAQQIKAERQATSESTTPPYPASAKHPETPQCAENPSGTPSKDGCWTGSETGPQHGDEHILLHGATRACIESDSADDCDSWSQCCSPRVPEELEGSEPPVSCSDAPRSISWSVEDVDPSIQYWIEDIYGDEMQERIARKFRKLRLRQWHSAPELL